MFTGVDLTVRGPERIALTGPNGSGKSTLLQLILDGSADGRGRVAYLSQRLDLLDVDRTLLENLVAWAPSMPNSERKRLLARFLFRSNRIDLSVGVLSGGERLRATLASVLFADPAPTCCCSTSRPTTWTWPASRNWNQRSPHTRAP